MSPLTKASICNVRDDIAESHLERITFDWHFPPSAIPDPVLELLLSGESVQKEKAPRRSRRPKNNRSNNPAFIPIHSAQREETP
jgi:hypothetical protein